MTRKSRPKSTLISRIFRNSFRQDMHAEQYYEPQESGEIDTEGFPNQADAYQPRRY